MAGRRTFTDRSSLRALAALLLAFLAPARSSGAASPADRFLHLEERSPFAVGPSFAKLTTPQWFGQEGGVGEEGVEAVVILSIDDMRESGKYRAFLEPIQKRLRELQGESPLSIFTNRADPSDPQLQRWLEEGVRFDVHTRSHPCPLLSKDLPQARAEVLGCLDDLHRIPGARPLAFRMPCCDSINSASPRFFWEILPRRSPEGRHLEVDSSVVVFLEESFRAYAPFPRYAATADRYPYPWVVARVIWEFPILAPSDWQAQHRHGPFSPRTVEDLKRALDLTVEAQGVFTFCFHPHGWIRSEQVVELIDHAAARHGRRVRFLNFHQALDRMERHLLGGTRLRAPDGEDQGVRLLDLDGDGFLDVVAGSPERLETRLWDPRARRHRVFPFPFPLAERQKGTVERQGGTAERQKGTAEREGEPAGPGSARETGVKFGVLRRGSPASALVSRPGFQRLAHLEGDGWREAPLLGLSTEKGPVHTSREGRDRGVRLHDLDADGFSDLLVSNEEENAAFRWDPEAERFTRLPWALPSPASICDGEGRDRGLRFADLNADGWDDVFLSNDDESYVYLREGPARGWSGRVVHGPAGSSGALPRIVSRGEDRGAWVREGVLHAASEETAGLPDLVDAVPLASLLERRPPRPLEPAEALPLFQVPEGFRVELVAAEPLVTDPVSLTFGPDGRVWVAEMGSYPRGEGRDSGGSIKVLRDADGDGRAERAAVFADGLTFPTGAFPWGQGVLVTCAPDILLLEDTDGDDRADRRRVVFTGFGEGNTQHRVNGLQLGIDNWIHGANGDSGGTIRLPGNPAHPPVPIGGRDFRFTLDLARFEADSGRTQFGLAQDDLGNRFGCSNARHLLHAVLPERSLRRNPHHAPPDPVVDIPDHGAMCRLYPLSPLEPPLNAIHVPGHTSSACGLTFYRGDRFPPEYRGSAFVCEPVANLVHRDRLEPRGATFRASRGEEGREFLASPDPWFRPVFLANGPDGALYVVDMYRPVIEHPDYIPRELHRALDFTAGRDRGRIWRVVWAGNGPPGPAPLCPDLSKRNTEALAELLDHPGGWWRDAARLLLLERQAREAAGSLRALSRSPRPLTRVLALWMLEGLGVLEEASIAQALADPEPAVREHALRLATPRLGRSTGLGETGLGKAVLEGARDPDFRVRLEAAQALGEIRGPEAAQALLEVLSRDLEDPWMRAAAVQSALPHAGRLLGSLLRPRPEKESQEAGWRAALEGLVATVARGGDPADLEAAFEGVDSSAQAARHHVILLGAWLEAGKPLPAPTPGWAGAVRARAREALEGEGPPAERAEAVRALGESLAAAEDLARRLLGPREPPEVQQAAARALARTAGPGARLLLAAWPGLGPSARSEALEGLLARPEGAVAVLNGIAEGLVGAHQLDSPSRERLLASADAAVRGRADKLFPRRTAGEREEVVARLRRELASLRGDARRGKEPFRKHCAPCHRLEGDGVNVGPDLLQSQGKDRDLLLEAILNPGRMVPPRYTPYLVETPRGLSTGLIAAETATAITLLRAGGVEEAVLRSDVLRLSALGESLMPTGLEKTLSPQELADLLEFLQRAGTKR